MKRFVLIPVFVSWVVGALCSAVVDDTPKSTFAQLQESANSCDWETLLSLMTPSAQKSVIAGEISSAAMAMDREFPPGPAGDRHREKIGKVFSDYKVDDVERPAPPDFLQGQPSEDAMAAFLKAKDAYVTQVLERLGNPNAFLVDLSRVLADSPVPVGATIAIRLGVITKVEVEGNVAKAIVEVDPSKLSDDPTVINVMPPTPIQFEMSDEGDWKYAGIDVAKQRELAERHQDLWIRENPSDGGDALDSATEHATQDEEASEQLMLTASWVPFDDESTYGFAEKWPEINEMKPVADEKAYQHSFFGAMTPENGLEIGEVWKLDENSMLPLLKQFHLGASCQLHHGGPTGAYGCLIGSKGVLQRILIRLHGEIRHEDGWYYTVSQFEGHLIWNCETKRVQSFRLFVPPIRTNVDVNRSVTIEELRNETEYKGLTGVDIGFVPKMELASGQEVEIEWETEIDLKEAKDRLAKKFYRSAEIEWLPWEAAVGESQRSGKPLLVIALFGTLFDESC